MWIGSALSEDHCHVTDLGLIRRVPQIGNATVEDSLEPPPLERAGGLVVETVVIVKVGREVRCP